MDIIIRKVEATKIPPRKPKTRARRSAGGPITQYIVQLKEDNPDMKHADIADMVKAKYDHARTSEKSVASSLYRAGFNI